MTSPWISIDNPPPVDQHVLLRKKDGSILAGFRTFRGYVTRFSHYAFDATHWMPVPPPPPEEPSPSKAEKVIDGDRLCSMLEKYGWKFMPLGPNEYSWLKFDGSENVMAYEGGSEWYRDIARIHLEMKGSQHG